MFKVTSDDQVLKVKVRVLVVAEAETMVMASSVEVIFATKSVAPP